MLLLDADTVSLHLQRVNPNPADPELAQSAVGGTVPASGISFNLQVGSPCHCHCPHRCPQHCPYRCPPIHAHAHKRAREHSSLALPVWKWEHLTWNVNTTPHNKSEKITLSLLPTSPFPLLPPPCAPLPARPPALPAQSARRQTPIVSMVYTQSEILQKEVYLLERVEQVFLTWA